ncbi:MAG: hypothetical protein KF716_14995 [Anaerolineae bacterium]|nr:hypothetical protein [Anaerolineae bacterium]
MKVSIKRVSIWSVMKTGCLMTAIPIIVVAVLLIIGFFIPSAAFTRNVGYQFGFFGGGISAAFFVIMYALFIGAVTAIGWGLLAVVYNVVAWMFGGIEISLRREDMPAQAQPPSSPPEPEPAQKRKTSSPDGISWYNLSHDEKEIIRKRRAQQGDYTLSHMKAEDGSFPIRWDEQPKHD